jgi:hypothetical protein
MRFIIAALVVVAFIIGVLLLFSVSFGTLTPHFVAIAILCLAAALSILTFG